MIETWFNAKNLHEPREGTSRQMEGEALTYALVTYFVRPTALPDAVRILLAEGCFARWVGADALES